MRCPGPCFICGEEIELSDARFHTGYCECDPDRDCTHGVCEECYDEVWCRTDEED